ncbi:MAG: hypothetical protein WC770_03015 [Phycisphaerae bacterium]|jgi:hypothetical protein
MKKIVKVFLMVCIFCPVLSAEPNQASGRAVGDPNILGQQQNSQQNERRQQRLRRRMNYSRSDANQRAVSGEEYTQRQQAREKQMGDEYLKNKRRIAVLTRIKELAIATNQPEKAQKADSLIQMENKRHHKKILGLQTRPASPATRLENIEPNNK